MLHWISVLMTVVLLPATCNAQEKTDSSPDQHQSKPSEKSKPKANGESVTWRGVVTEYHQSPKGEVDGLVLNDATEIRFPPHLSDKVMAAITSGDRNEVHGHQHTGPMRDTHVRAVSIRNLKLQVDVILDSPPVSPELVRGRETTPVRRLPHNEQILSEIRLLRALVNDQKGDRVGDQAAPIATRPHHEQILSELREPRTAIEKRLRKADKPAGPKKQKTPAGDFR